MSKKVVSIDSEETETPMYKIAAFIVDKRNLFFLLFIFALIFSVFSKNWVSVENDITQYLPETTETRQGLTLMDEEFITYGSASVMVSNITYETAEELKKRLESINGVSGIELDDSEEHFKNASAMFSVTFEGEADDEISRSAMEKIKSELSGYDVYISSEVGNDASAQLAEEMGVVTLIAAGIILVVLFFTSKSYAEIPVLIMTFGAAAVLNMGTNFMAAPPEVRP